MPDIQKTPPKDRKIVTIGLANLLTKSQQMLGPGVAAW